MKHFAILIRIPLSSLMRHFAKNLTPGVGLPRIIPMGNASSHSEDISHFLGCQFLLIALNYTLSFCFHPLFSTVLCVCNECTRVCAVNLVFFKL